MAFAHAHAVPLTLNRPIIRVAAMQGAVTINANTTEPLLDEYNGSFDLWGGLLSWVRDNANPGKVEVQALKDITVNGHGADPTAPVRDSFGAIAAIATASDAPGGLVDVRSIDGKIIGNDRAFDVSGRNRLATNFARIRLWANKDIVLSRPGASASFNPVVDASSPSVGDKGGTNEIRSFTGNITINTNALISAKVPAGSGTVQGINLLTSCGGVTNNGTVDPVDAVPGDDSGTCSPAAPEPIFSSCGDFGVTCSCSQSSIGSVVINEVYYDVGPGKGAETDDEWVELYNKTGQAINLKNWTLADNTDTRSISTSDISIPANGFALISKSTSTWTSFWSPPAGAVQIALGNNVGGGLANEGDRLVLKNNLGVTMDKMSYGTDITIWNPAATDVADGHSLERNPDGTDTDLPADFIDRTLPTPGT